MTNIIFLKNRFFKTIAMFVVLSAIWTELDILMDGFTHIDKGLVSGLGYLILLSMAFCFGQSLKKPLPIIALTVLIIVIFLTSSFVLLPLFINSNNTMFYSILSSIFVSVTMTFVLNKKFGIYFKTATAVLTSLSLLFFYY